LPAPRPTIESNGNGHNLAALRARQQRRVVSGFFDRKRDAADHDNRVREEIVERIWLRRSDSVGKRRCRAINSDAACRFSDLLGTHLRRRDTGDDDRNVQTSRAKHSQKLR
jgi:hypothetical protein